MANRPNPPPRETTIALVKQIRHSMIDAGIHTNAELAAKAGLSGPTIGRILGGRRSLTIEELGSIAKALGMRTSELVIAAMERP